MAPLEKGLHPILDRLAIPSLYLENHLDFGSGCKCGNEGQLTGREEMTNAK